MVGDLHGGPSGGGRRVRSQPSGASVPYGGGRYRRVTAGREVRDGARCSSPTASGASRPRPPTSSTATCSHDDDGTLTLRRRRHCSGAPKTVLGRAGRARQGARRRHAPAAHHAHNDHTGGAAAGCSEATGARRPTHEREAVYVREGRMPHVRPLDPRRAADGAGCPARQGLRARSSVDGTFADGEVLPLAGGLHRRAHARPHARATAPSCTRAAACSSPATRLQRPRPALLVQEQLHRRPAVAGVGRPARRARLRGRRLHARRRTSSTGARAAVRAFLAGRPS